ncbi:HD domain-containing protein [Candidatus Roizmanbacteria bacterium]|nr:HD domain-containing protein [Candidatus Roizmanbacteria bacterium]
MKRDIELLYEVGCMRFLQRNWRQFLNADFSNETEHTFRVIWIALVLAKHEGVKDLGKITQLALVHDIGESRSGDVHYVSRQYTKRDEGLAVRDIFQETSLDQEMLAVWKEYEERKTIESKIVKDADNLDVEFELKEQEAKGEQIGKYWRDARQIVYQNLFTKSAKRMWQEIQKSNPHDWHFFARNRFTAGDWKSKK